jgi:U3 small nucleolar RNA-associated protein 12
MYRLRGHRGQITAAAFVSSSLSSSPSTSAASSSPTTHLVTASKDTYIKLWDLSTQHCIETVVGHRSEIWDFDVHLEGGDEDAPADITLVSGGGEGEAKAWSLNPDVLANGIREGPDGKLVRGITPLAASLPLATISHAQRISQVKFHPSMPYLAVQTGEKTVEVLRLRTAEEIKKKMIRRKKREREKKKEKGEADAEVAEKGDVEDKVPEWKDRLASWIVVRAGGKIRSFDWAPEKSSKKAKGEAQVRPHSHWHLG